MALGVISIIMTEFALGTGIKCSIVGTLLRGVSFDAFMKLDCSLNLLVEIVLGMVIRIPGIPINIQQLNFCIFTNVMVQRFKLFLPDFGGS